MDLAREGFQHLKTAQQLFEKYPQDMGEQTKIQGTWKMITGEATLQQLKAKREKELELLTTKSDKGVPGSAKL